jgi:hypothetical protein
MRRSLWLMSMVALAFAAGAAGCFSPTQPACAFSCATDGLCPAAYTCRSDGLCHRADGKGVCLLGPDDAGAATDTAANGTGG